jgi:hypothetical protein
MVESFIIQIYRRDDERHKLTGTVERIKDGSMQCFSSVEELWHCLSTKPSRRDRRLPKHTGSESQTSEGNTETSIPKGAKE